MSATERLLDQARLYDALMGTPDVPGVFERVAGFRTSTTAIKGVHVMNDLAQCVVGGAPAHGGDLLCRVIRQDKVAEGNADADLRARAGLGTAYATAFPEELGTEQIRRLRRAAELVLNFDGGIYEPGKRMCSGLATHRLLLGFEGFRRFGVGRFLHAVLSEAGRARLATLLHQDSDPVTTALRPLLVEDRLRDVPHWSGAEPELTPFDRSFGRRLSVLLEQPLTKPHLLRSVALMATLGILLKVLGAGRPGGRPLVLALTQDQPGPGPRPARQEAVQALARAIEALDRRVAEVLVGHPSAADLWTAAPDVGIPGFAVPSGESLEAAAPALVAQLRSQGLERDLYWPDEFAIALGRKAGAVLPRSDRAGWGKYLALTPDLVEALVLMFVPHGAAPLAWEALWTQVASDLGLVIGARGSADAQALSEAGVLHINLQHLTIASDAVLEYAVRSGVARRLPDSGAEAGGELQ